MNDHAGIGLIQIKREYTATDHRVELVGEWPKRAILSERVVAESDFIERIFDRVVIRLDNSKAVYRLSIHDQDKAVYTAELEAEEPV